MFSLTKKLSWSSIKSIHSNVLRTHKSAPKKYIKKGGPGLEYFIYNSSNKSVTSSSERNNLITNDIKSEKHPYINSNVLDGTGKKVHVEVYGCQMNVNDTEIIHSILSKHNYTQTSSLNDADILLLMTCAIREGAEHKIWHRLAELKAHRKQKKGNPSTVGIIGCMAERLKEQLLERDTVVDVIAGPDSYRSLPYLLSQASSHQAAIDVILSLDETYADVLPVRLNPKSPSAYVSIMRGCDNMCSYCIVPFTRGKERSRPIDSIIDEVRHLSELGIKEITLLGQNVNSYRDSSSSVYFGEATSVPLNEPIASGFKTVYKPKIGGRRFADLLEKVSNINPEIRIRFTSPHPKDFPDEVLQLIKERPNICKSLHLPAQAGSNRVLSLMRRNYTREAYLELVDKVIAVCGSQVALSSDFICGFCGETESEFLETLDLVERVPYSTCYIFPYSLREKTSAHRRYHDDVSLAVKTDRVNRLNQVFREKAEKINRSLIGSTQLVLVEGESKRSDAFLAGRCDGNVKVVFPKENFVRNGVIETVQPGDYVAIKVHDATSQVLKGKCLCKTTLSEFYGQTSGVEINPLLASSSTGVLLA